MCVIRYGTVPVVCSLEDFLKITILVYEFLCFVEPYYTPYIHHIRKTKKEKAQEKIHPNKYIIALVLVLLLLCTTRLRVDF